MCCHVRCCGRCFQRRTWVNIVTWRRFVHAVNTVTSSPWRRRCLDGCVSVAVSHLMPTWLHCSSWTQRVSAARLMYSVMSTESAPADRPVTSASQIRNYTPSNLALDPLPCTWRPAIPVLPVTYTYRFVFNFSSHFPGYPHSNIMLEFLIFRN